MLSCKHIMLTLLLAMLSLGMARAADADYTIDNDGNVVVSKIVEGINATKADIYAAARKYITNAYKVTKYRITNEDEEVGTVIGKGTLLNYCSINLFPSTYYVTSDFFLRIDAKEGRARISVYVLEYGGQRVNINVTEELHIRICDTPPVGDKAEVDSRLTNKAFPLLIEQMKGVLAEVEETLSKVATIQSSEW